MEIYKYYHNTKEWREIVNSKLKNKEKEAAFDNYIKECGVKVSLQDYFKDYQRKKYFVDYSYKCFGEATNCFERLAKGEIDWDNDLRYCDKSESHPEDLVEERTDWGKMKSYADGLADFISLLKSEIADGTLTISTITE